MAGRKKLKRVLEDEEEEEKETKSTTPVLNIAEIKRNAAEEQRKRTEEMVKRLEQDGTPTGNKKKPTVAKRAIRNSLISSAVTAAAAQETPQPQTTTISSSSAAGTPTTAQQQPVFSPVATTTPPGAPTPISKTSFQDTLLLHEAHTVVQAAPRADQRRNISHNFSSFVLDCDGVLWHSTSPVEGSSEAIRELRSRANTKLHFVTNNSTGSRAMLATKLAQMLNITDIDPLLEITTSGSACAAMIKNQFPNVTRAFVIGEQGLIDELALVQISSVTSGPVDVVVCGLDTKFTFEKLFWASNYVQQCGILFATNLDAYDMLDNGQQGGTMPGAGCLVKALLESLPAPPKHYIVCGKPNGAMLKWIMQQRNMHMEDTIVIGDRVDTDIEFAINAGVSSCLVLTGVAREFSPRASFMARSLHDFCCN